MTRNGKCGLLPVLLLPCVLSSCAFVTPFPTIRPAIKIEAVDITTTTTLHFSWSMLNRLRPFSLSMSKTTTAINGTSESLPKREEKITEISKQRTNGESLQIEEAINQCQPPPDGYCPLVDFLGCVAYENKLSVTVQKNNFGVDNADSEGTMCVRLEALPDKEFDHLNSPQSLLKKIQQVESLQGEFRRADLYRRKWLPLNTNKTLSNAHYFTAMQFNMLAEGLSSGPDVATPFNEYVRSTLPSKQGRGGNDYGGFTEVPHPDVCLDFTHRRWRLLEVILKTTNGENTTEKEDMGPDILALEEVDRFGGFFQPALAKFGYKSLFIPKPKAPGINLGFYSDGCALFWKESKFELLAEKRGVYQDGKQVYIVGTLRHRCSGSLLIVAVTHLKAQNSDTNEKIRMQQVSELLDVVSQAILDAEACYDGANIPVMIMGDFNSDYTERNQSCIHQILHDPLRKLRLCSAYDCGNGSSNSFFTSWKTRGEKTSKRVIDYIFHSCPSTCTMKCTHILSIPHNEDVEQGLLPGFRHPSDHLNIAAKFQILSDTGNKKNP